MNEEFDFEQELFDAHEELDRRPSAQRQASFWGLAAHIATLITRSLPGSRVTAGSARTPEHVDYIPPEPQFPLAVFGPQGQFIVTFLDNCTWIESDGRVANTRGFIEGSPESIARFLVRTAGIEERGVARRQPHPRQPRRPSPGQLPRLLEPTDTRTWRDGYPFPEAPKWPVDAPPSLCRQSDESRIILTPYTPHSCTYWRGYGQERWGIETLQIPRLPSEDPFGPVDADEIHEGDCLVTVGAKSTKANDADADTTTTAVWHPQRVIHVETEGNTHLRVWLIRDADVANENFDPTDFEHLTAQQVDVPRVLADAERQEVLEMFNLDVFCPVCSARATPIIYGMPGPDSPSYYAVGGCLIDPENPNYTCTCGHTWPLEDFA